MDAITMPSMKSLISHLVAEYPQFSFQTADQFAWSPTERVIYINPSLTHSNAFVLHELSHAILGHHNYDYDIELIKLERNAWAYAQELSEQYRVTIDEDVVQDNLDTYRDWLHSRSTCPGCYATGLQIGEKAYRCLACKTEWCVNEARICGLRRIASSKIK